MADDPNETGSGANVDSTWDHDANAGTPEIDRWTSLWRVVQFLVTEYGMTDKIVFAAKSFPSQNDTLDVCGVTTGFTAGFGDDILAAIPGEFAWAIGGTPIASGYQATLDAIVADTGEGQKGIILVTDGAISCDESAATVQTAIANAYTNLGIPTFVVGIALQGQAVADMNGYAVAGGYPKGVDGDPERFFNAANQVELQSALDGIVEQVVSCEIELSMPPQYPELTEVEIEGIEYEQVEDCATEDGWQYTDDTNSAIVLCGAACDGFKAALTAEVKYFCPVG
jgi:hypothetical protein